MGMTVIVVRDVEGRYRGFLSSCMLEIAPGVFTSPRMTPSVRERVWRVLEQWYLELGRGSIVLTWRSKDEPGGQGILQLGSPPRQLHAHDGFVLVRREVI